jgi:hypothetical protein
LWQFGGEAKASRIMSYRRAFALRTGAALGFFALTILVSVTAPGCSSSDDSPACDDSKCAPGNHCLPLNGETKCRKVCDSNAPGQHADGTPFVTCPFNYTCVSQSDGNTFCVDDTAKLTKKDKGQWGSPCNPSQGSDNPDCDKEQEFYCYGEGPTDGKAYCTRFSCETDRDCGARFWCATVNVGPSADSAKRTIQQVQKVCLVREYCAACNTNVDCPPLDGHPQYCVPDDAGRNFCAPECTASTECVVYGASRCVDAGATDSDGTAKKTCYQRSGVCVGDGSLCSSCLSDTDCGDDGACVRGQYTTEKSCAKKAPQSCNNGQAQGGCVQNLTTPKVAIRCLGGTLNEAPKDYCHGLYSLGQSGDVGCWTPAK